MNTVLKIYRGTARGDSPRLCDSCRYGLVRKSAKDGHEEVYCAVMRGPVLIVITECNRYDDYTQPSLFDLERIAWVLEIDRRRQQIGFIPAAEARRRNEENSLQCLGSEGGNTSEQLANCK